MRKAAVILLLVFLTVILTSCYDAVEIDDMAHVVMIGVDRGVSDKWRLTLQFRTMQKAEGGGSKESGGQMGAGGADENAGDYAYVSIDSPSFFAGVNMLNTSLSRKLNFMHAQIIVFSEEVAKAGLIGEYIAPIIRFREIRWSAHVLVVKGKALDFIKKNKPFIGSLVSKSFQLLIGESDQTGFFPHVTLGDFYAGINSTYCQPLATIGAVNEQKNFKEEGEPFGTEYRTGGEYVAGQLPRSGENKLELFGTAVFVGDTMVDELNGDETRYLLMVRGEFDRGIFTVQDPQKPELIIPLDVTTSREPDIKVSFDGQVPNISVKVELNADILAIQSDIHYEQPELKEFLENTFANFVKDGIEGVIKKCQNLNADIFRFGGFAVKNFLTIDQWESYNWNERFKDAKVSVDVKVTIRRTGTQINPIKD